MTAQFTASNTVSYDIPTTCDVAVVGAGPAGLAAASLAAKAGLSVLLLDENAGPGGQVYRAITASPLAHGAVLGPDYWSGAQLAQEMLASSTHYVPGATVWALNADKVLNVSVAGRAYEVKAGQVILATGALERPMPIPGWTLPGVMTAGGAQTLLKTSGLVPKGRTVLAGCGPLLWLLAAQYLEAGGQLTAILDTTPKANWRAALPALPAFLASPYALKGLALLRKVKAKVKIIKDVTALEAIGTDSVRAVTYTTASGSTGRFEVDLLLLHQGVTPNVNLANAAGIPLVWDEDQACFRPEVGPDGASPVAGIFVAGDGAGIGGALGAAERGRLAALAAIAALKPSSPVLGEAPQVRATLARALRGRAFLDRLYRPSDAFRRPAPDTIVCRCEEVTARQITDAASLGCSGPNQLKSFLRTGMGPCQGRMCGLTVSELLADARGVSPAEIGYYRLRAPVKPITVAELASLPRDDSAMKSVERG